MATVKEATAAAIAFARDALGDERTSDIRLEEIESTTTEDGKPAWRITLSMRSLPPSEKEGVTSLGDIAALFSTRREYKTFTVFKHNGEVESMKMRQLADA